MSATVRATLALEAAALRQRANLHQRGNLYALWPVSVVMANMICSSLPRADLRSRK
jgi:hypothetical protein